MFRQYHFRKSNNTQKILIRNSKTKYLNLWAPKHLTQRFFIGVEGGATSCTVKIKNEYEDLGQYTLFQGVNICSQPHEKVWITICDAINYLLRKKSLTLTDRDLIFYACFGLAGAASPDARERFIEYGKEHHNFFKEIILETDSNITLTGAFAGKKGAVIIIGTGTVALYKDDKHSIRAGGYGFPHGDEGGWAWIGLKTINYLFKIADGCLYSSLTMDEVFQKYFHGNFNELVQWANGLPKPSVEQYAQIGRYLVANANHEDTYVIQIIKEAASYLNQLYDALEIKCLKEKIKDFPYCLWGGIADYVTPYLKEEFLRKIVKPIAIPVDGALMKLQQFSNISLVNIEEKFSYDCPTQSREIGSSVASSTNLLGF